MPRAGIDRDRRMTATAPADTSPSSGVALGIFTIVMTLLGWTSIPLFLKFFSADIDPYTANGWRYTFSALIWMPALVWAWRRGRLPKGVWLAALVPALFNTLGQHWFGIAPYKIDPGLMTFALRVHVVFVTVGAALLFAAERRVIKTPAYLTGLAMVMGGTTLTLLLKPGEFGQATREGVLLSIGAGASYAAYALSVRKLMVGMNPLLAFAAVSQYTAVALLIVMFILGKDHGAMAMHLPGWKFGLLVLSSIIGIGMGHTFYFLAIQRLGLAVANGVVQLQPVTVSIASLFLFDERLSGGQWAAGLMAVAGAGVILWAQSRLSAADARQARAARQAGDAPPPVIAQASPPPGLRS